MGKVCEGEVEWWTVGCKLCEGAGFSRMGRVREGEAVAGWFVRVQTLAG